jgi:hypothetical protein
MWKAVLLMLALAGCCDANDAACEMAQYNAITGFSAGYNMPYRPAPVFIGCTTVANVTNCIGQ